MNFETNPPDSVASAGTRVPFLHHPRRRPVPRPPSPPGRQPSCQLPPTHNSRRPFPSTPAVACLARAAFITCSVDYGSLRTGFSTSIGLSNPFSLNCSEWSFTILIKLFSVSYSNSLNKIHTLDCSLQGHARLGPCFLPQPPFTTLRTLCGPLEPHWPLLCF